MEGRCVKVNKLIKNEIIHHYKSFFYIILTLVISLVGITLVESFKESFSSHLSGKAKDILGSDLKIIAVKMTKEIESRVEGVISAVKSTSLINTFSMGRPAVPQDLFL